MKKSKLFLFCFLVVVFVGLSTIPATAWPTDWGYCPRDEDYCHDYCSQWGGNYLCMSACMTYVYPNLCSWEGLCCNQ